MNDKEYLKPYVEVKEADGSLFSKFILFLDPSHLNNTQTLWLGWQGLHTQRLQAVLNVIEIQREDYFNVQKVANNQNSLTYTYTHDYVV